MALIANMGKTVSPSVTVGGNARNGSVTATGTGIIIVTMESNVGGHIAKNSQNVTVEFQNNTYYAVIPVVAGDVVDWYTNTGSNAEHGFYSEILF